jgi:NADH-quinone oxidoreductase subunit J
MTVAFYIAGLIAIAATVRVITGTNPVHSLLYLIVSLLAVALVFFVLGAPFIAALEVIVYAGAIMVLFVFVIMMLNLGPQTAAQERQWLNIRMWRGPGALALILLAELVYVLHGTAGRLPLAEGTASTLSGQSGISPRLVGFTLFGPYLIGVELASLLLLAGLVGAFYLGRRETGEKEGPRS